MSGPHKKGGHEEGGGGHAPAWIVSFADLVILLMSFFVLLLVMGQQKTTVDEDQLKIIASVKSQFGYIPKIDSKDPLDMAVLQIQSQKKGGFVHSGQRWKSAAVKGTSAKERDSWLKAQSPIGKPFHFAKNSAKLTDVSKGNLEEIAEVIRHHYRMIIIQAHCSDEEAAKDALGGDDLTFRRAIAVKQILEDQGVAAWRLRPVLCSSHESRKALNTTNRQIVIVTLGSYYLPNEHDVVDEGNMPSPDEAAPAKDSGHGGH